MDAPDQGTTRQGTAQTPTISTGEQQLGGEPTDASLSAAPPVLRAGHRSLAALGARLLFEKVMTTCDVSGNGRIVVPKVCDVAPHTPSSRGWQLVKAATSTCFAAAVMYV